MRLDDFEQGEELANKVLKSSFCVCCGGIRTLDELLVLSFEEEKIGTRISFSLTETEFDFV